MSDPSDTVSMPRARWDQLMALLAKGLPATLDVRAMTNDAEAAELLDCQVALNLAAYSIGGGPLYTGTTKDGRRVCIN